MEILEIIKGLNEEKRLITIKLVEMTDYAHSSVQVKTKVLSERLAVVDGILKDLQDKLLPPRPRDLTKEK